MQALVLALACWAALALTASQPCLATGAAASSTPRLPTQLLNFSALGPEFQGVGGLAAIGGARLLYEYAEPLRSQLLDMLFLPNRGAAYQILKTEIEGDGDSSYGSGPSFMHVADPQQASWSRGIYLPWLIPAAKARNAGLKLYSLSWGVPFWVGNGTYLSDQGVDYHVSYLAGALAQHNISFDYTGIWNEDTWSRTYIKKFRAALDAAGSQHTQLVFADGAPTVNDCRDCPASWQSLSDALAQDPQLLQAVQIMGVHGSTPISAMPGNWSSLGARLWNSEQNIVDDPMPQFLPTPDNPYGSALAWPRTILTNYITANATATILCPITHSWSWQYGRNNHGHSFFVQPWSGHFQLGAAFWGQAHITQYTRIGWRFLAVGHGAQIVTQPDLVYATLVSPTHTDFSLIVVNGEFTSTAVDFQLCGGPVPAATVLYWRCTTIAAFFALQSPALAVDSQRRFSVALPARSVCSISTLNDTSDAQPQFRQRAPLPLPVVSDFDAQPNEAPGRFMMDLYGSFAVHTLSADQYPKHAGDKGLLQVVTTDPGPNAWRIRGGQPFTSFPTGANLAHANCSLLLHNASLQGTLRLCGRVPIWQPATLTPDDGKPLGVCFSLDTVHNNTWWLFETVPGRSSTTLASGQLQVHNPQPWVSLSLAFLRDHVQVLVGGQLVVNIPAAALNLTAGVCGISTAWNSVLVDHVVEAGAENRNRTSMSFLHDILPGSVLPPSLRGWAGFVLNLTDSQSELQVSALGRFRLATNTGQHQLQIVRQADNATVAGPVAVDMQACQPDALGFCYASLPSVRTLPPAVYYVLSWEDTLQDAVLEMTDPCAATTHAHRDGTTTMTYPCFNAVCSSIISGRISQDGRGQWTITSEMDTSFGPLNLVLG